MSSLVLVPACGPPELLPSGTRPVDVFQQVPLNTHDLTDSTTMFWLHSSYHNQELNEYGTHAAGYEVLGDVCLLHNDALCENDIDGFLHTFYPHSKIDQYFKRSSEPPRDSLSKSVRDTNYSTSYATHVFPLSVRLRRPVDLDPEGKHSKRPADALNPVCKFRRSAMASTPGIISCKFTEEMPKSDWNMLMSDLTASIFSCLTSVRDLIAVCGVCHRWRKTALEMNEHLKQVPFSVDCCSKPFRQSGQKFQSRHCDHLPAIFSKALDLENQTAMRCYGMMLDEAELGIRSVKIWRRLFNLGDVYGCWKMGEILYEGRDYMPMDQPEAFLAFSRAAKKAKQMDPGVEQSEILGRVGIYLGYCYLDGDAGQKEDNEMAVSWFRLAARHGNEDAQRVCGWIFNTGMYG